MDFLLVNFFLWVLRLMRYWGISVVTVHLLEIVTVSSRVRISIHRRSQGVQWVHLHPQGGEKHFFQA